METGTEGGRREAMSGEQQGGGDHSPPNAVTNFTSDPKEKRMTKEAAEAIFLMAMDRPYCAIPEGAGTPGCIQESDADARGMDPGDDQRDGGLYAAGAPGILQILMTGCGNRAAHDPAAEPEHHFSAEDGQRRCRDAGDANPGRAGGKIRKNGAE